jgi:hypothetical protein
LISYGGRHIRYVMRGHPPSIILKTNNASSCILGAVESFKIIEAYPEDKYLPSFLILAKGEKAAFHVLGAIGSASQYIEHPQGTRLTQRA